MVIQSNPNIPPELAALKKFHYGECVFESNVHEYPEEIQEIIETILHSDQQAVLWNLSCRQRYTKGTFKEDSLKIAWNNIHVSKVERDDGIQRYWVNFTRSCEFDNTFWQCWYQFSPDVKDFSRFYGARLKHQIFGKTGEKPIQYLGTFEYLLNEKPKDRLKRIFNEEGIDSFLELILHNTSGDYHWDDRDSTELLKKEEITIDEYLDKAAYVTSPYDIETPVMIACLKSYRFIEAWCSAARPKKINKDN